MARKRNPRVVVVEQLLSVAKELRENGSWWTKMHSNHYRKMYAESGRPVPEENSHQVRALGNQLRSWARRLDIAADIALDHAEWLERETDPR